MGAKELAWFGGFGRVICRANMTDVIMLVYLLSSGFLEAGCSRIEVYRSVSALQEGKSA